MTYGKLRKQITQLAEGVSLPLLDTWIVDRYEEILGRLQWQRLRQVRTIQTVAAYATGTIAVTNGSTSVVGTGTAWTAAMDGREIRVGDRRETYIFQFVDATTGTLDRGFEGDTASGAAHEIRQRYYELGTDVRLVESVERSGRPIDRRDASILSARDTWASGAPCEWALGFDDESDPPLQRVELWPVPDLVYSLHVVVVKDASVESGETGASLLPWVSPGCLKAGVQADAALWKKDFTQAEAYEGRFEKLLKEMVAQECARQGPQVMRMDDYFTRHRMNRWTR